MSSTYDFLKALLKNPSQPNTAPFPTESGRLRYLKSWLNPGGIDETDSETPLIDSSSVIATDYYGPDNASPNTGVPQQESSRAPALGVQPNAEEQTRPSADNQNVLPPVYRDLPNPEITRRAYLETFNKIRGRRKPSAELLQEKIRGNWLNPDKKDTEFSDVAGLDDNEPDWFRPGKNSTDIAIDGENGYTADRKERSLSDPAGLELLSNKADTPALYSTPTEQLQGDDAALPPEQQAIILQAKRDYSTDYWFYQAAVTAGDTRAASYWKGRMNDRHNAAEAARAGANAALSDLEAAANGSSSYDPEKGSATINVNGVEKTAYFSTDSEGVTTADIGGQSFAVHNGHILMNNQEFDKLFGNNAIINPATGAQYISNIKSTVTPGRVSVTVSQTFPDLIANNTISNKNDVDNSFYQGTDEASSDIDNSDSVSTEPGYGDEASTGSGDNSGSVADTQSSSNTDSNSDYDSGHSSSSNNKPPQFAGNDDLGYLSGIYESHSDPGSISGGYEDPGGKSYGAFQFSSEAGTPESFMAWLKGQDSKLYRQLQTAYDVDGGTGDNFDAAWNSIANQNKEYFLSLQYKYVKSAYYDANAESVKKATGFDINTRGYALKNVFWSTSILWGDDRLIRRVLTTLDLNTASDEEIIRAIFAADGAVKTPEPGYSGNIMSGKEAEKYGVSGKYLVNFRGSGPSAQLAIWKRLNIDELNDALKLLKQFG